MSISQLKNNKFNKPEIEFLRFDATDVVSTSSLTCSINPKGYDCTCGCFYTYRNGVTIIYHDKATCAGQVCFDEWSSKGYTNQQYRPY